MKIAYSLFWTIIIVEFAVAFRNIYKTIVYMHNNDKINLKKDKPTDCKMHIVIPCLREQDYIIDTLNYYLKLTDNYPFIDITVVTTKKEKAEFELIFNDISELKKDLVSGMKTEQLLDKYNYALSYNDILILQNLPKKDTNKILEFLNRKPSTDEVVSDFINKNTQRVFALECPNEKGVMADQLNYAFEHFKKMDNLANTYFMLYNADGRPSSETIKEVIEKINYYRFPKVMQQYSYCLSNYENLSWIMKGFALYQCNFELKYGLINSAEKSHFLFNHVVGHGLIIREDILNSLNGFSTDFWCEDIFMSCCLRNKDIDVLPLRNLEKMEAPMNLGILIKQNAVWFRTAFECLKMHSKIKEKDGNVNFSAKMWIIQRLIMNLNWLFSPIFVIFTILLPIIKLDLIGFIVAISSYFFMSVSLFTTTIKIIEKNTDYRIQGSIKNIFYATIAMLISNFGPIYSLITIKNKHKYKTAR